MSSATRRAVEARIAEGVLAACAALSVLVLVGIFVLLATNALRTFAGGVELQPITPEEAAALGGETAKKLSDAMLPPPTPGSFFGDTLWRPDAAKDTHYGILALIVSTVLTTFGALVLAVPVGVATAAWLAVGADSRVRDIVKYVVEMLAAVPSVVVGFIGLQIVGPIIGDVFGVPGGLTALNGSILLAIMALPTIVSISEDAISAVPRELVQGSLALGADRWQTLVRVIAPTARSGLFAAAMLGMGRAIGETMTVLMATGNTAAMPTSILDPVRTMTATIAIELGEVPRGTTHYYSLFVVGLVLFLLTLAVNLAADAVQRRQQRMFG